MTSWLLLCTATLIAVEIFLRTSFRKNVHELLDFTKRSTHTISSAKISDHWKEKVLLHYSGKIFINSLRLFLCLSLTVLPIIIIDYLGKLFETGIITLMMTPAGIAISIVLASLYVIIRVKVLHVRL